MRWDLASTLEQHQRWEVLTSASNTFILLVAVFCGTSFHLPLPPQPSNTDTSFQVRWS